MPQTWTLLELIHWVTSFLSDVHWEHPIPRLTVVVWSRIIITLVDWSPVSIQTQSLALRALRKRKPQETQAIAFGWKSGLTLIADVSTSAGKCSNKIDEPKRWKANFRCALNSLPGVCEVKHLGQTRGKDPFKVYQFLNVNMSRKGAMKSTYTFLV